MKLKNTLFQTAAALLLTLGTNGLAQTPQANFSISPNPVCAGAVVHITDLSTNSPTAWSYTLNTAQGPAGTTTSSVQNPTITYVNAGTKTITLIATNASGASTAVSLTLAVIAAPNLNIMPANASICPGHSLALTATTATGTTLMWSTGATSASISVSPTVTTTYSCTATNSAGCTASRITTVTVGQPTVTITGNPGTICGGSTVSLIANSSGQGPFTYSWSNAGSTKTITTNTPGVYTATVTSSSGCAGVQSFTVTSATSITVAAITNNSVICSGNNGNLFATGASSYSWSNGTTTQLNMVSPTVTTVYTVTGTSGTCSASATATIVVNTIPTLAVTSAPNSVCSGGSATITASGATTYSWTTGDATATTVVSPTANSTYTVRGANQGCQPRTATISIAVNASPTLVIVSNADTICAGQEVIFAASGASTYSWSTGATSAILTVTPAATSQYTVMGINSAGCTGSTSISQFVAECTGISMLTADNKSLLVYPNPSSGSIVLASHNAISLTLIDQTGRTVKAISLNESNAYSTTLAGLASGIYFIIGQSAAGSVKQKIIVAQ